MVDFPEYYEQMRPSLGSRDAPAPAAPAPRTETRQGDSPLTQRAALDPGFSDAPAFGPQRPAAPRRPAAASSETAEDLEQFQRDYLARLRAGPPQPARLSVLDMLRKRMEREMEGEDLRRIGEFGAGMLASGSPNFFTMLGSGARAAQQGDASRMDQLRRLADAERQQQELETRQAAQRAEEQYRQDSLRLRREEAARANRPQYQVVGQDAQGNAIVVDMRDPTQRQTLEGVTPLQVASLNARTEAQSQQTLARIVEAAVNREATNRNNTGRPFSDADRAAVRRQAEIEGRRILGLPPLQETGAAAGGGQPPPSQILQYGGPRINSQQQTGPRINSQPQPQQ